MTEARVSFIIRERNPGGYGRPVDYAAAVENYYLALLKDRGGCNVSVFAREIDCPPTSYSITDTRGQLKSIGKMAVADEEGGGER